MLQLIAEGVISPSAEEVAKRADVGLRTVFRHFDDMDSLYREISEVMSAELMPIAAAPMPEGGWRERLTELAARRSQVFEKMMPFKIAADVHRHRSAFLLGEHNQLNTIQRKILLDALLPEMDLAGPALEALDLLMSFDTWRRLRQDQKLSVNEAREAVLHTARLLLENEDQKR
jgi:AcrR family transcriptional regulator